MRHFDPSGGNFTQVSNDMMDLLASPHLNNLESSVLNVFLRFTVGWTGYEGKTPFVDVNLPISVLVASTGRSEKSVTRALAKLQECGILIAVKKGGGKEANRYCLNYDRETWILKGELSKVVPSREYYTECRRTSDLGDGATVDSSDLGDRATESSNKTADNGQTGADKNDRGGSEVGDRGGSEVGDRAKQAQTSANTSVAHGQRKEKEKKRKIPPMPPQGAHQRHGGEEDQDQDRGVGLSRTIVDMTDRGSSPSMIADTFNQAGMKTERGSEWKESDVRQIRDYELAIRDVERRREKKRVERQMEEALLEIDFGDQLDAVDEGTSPYLAMIMGFVRQGLDFNEIASHFNEAGYRTERNTQWYGAAVKELYDCEKARLDREIEQKDREKRELEEQERIRALAANADPRDVNQGRQRSMKGFIPPDRYGYREEDGIVVEDDLEQHFIGQIIKCIDGGWTAKEVAEELTHLKVSTKRGGRRWYPGTVTAIYEREKPREFERFLSDLERISDGETSC